MDYGKKTTQKSILKMQQEDVMNVRNVLTDKKTTPTRIVFSLSEEDIKADDLPRKSPLNRKSQKK